MSVIFVNTYWLGDWDHEWERCGMIKNTCLLVTGDVVMIVNGLNSGLAVHKQRESVFYHLVDYMSECCSDYGLQRTDSVDWRVEIKGLIY